MEIGLTQFDPLLAEKSESENFTQIWLTRCQTLYIIWIGIWILKTQFDGKTKLAKLTRGTTIWRD